MSEYFTAFCNTEPVELTDYSSRVSAPDGNSVPAGCLFNIGKLEELKEKYRPLFEADKCIKSIELCPVGVFFQLVTEPMRLGVDGVDPADPDSYDLYDWAEEGWRFSGLNIDRYGGAYLEYYLREDLDELCVYLS
jgi:hypothetical protein